MSGRFMEFFVLADAKTSGGGISFKDMTNEQRADWAIRFTNTLLQSQGKPLETGQGQHGRKSSESPDKSKVAPLEK